MSTYTKQQIRGAILRAADQIKSRPHLFNFGNCSIPDCGSPGCAIGWCGAELGLEGIINEASPILVGWADTSPVPHDERWLGNQFCDQEFYDRMDSIGPANWRTNAHECARALRAYADKYWPAEQLDPAYVAFKRALTGRALGAGEEA